MDFYKVSKNITIFTILNSTVFCADDENKKNIEIIIKYKGFEYKASNIEVTKDNFAEPDQRIEFIKANKNEFISGENKLNCTDLIKEVSEIGKWKDLKFDGKDECTLGDCNIKNHLKNLEKATIEIADYIEINYIKTDKKLKNKTIEGTIEKNIINFLNKQKTSEINIKTVYNKIKFTIKKTCNIDVNDDIFVLGTTPDKDGNINKSTTLKINFPDELIESNPDQKNKEQNNNNNNNGGNSGENKETKHYCGS